jgi:hypothetical protein
MKIKATCMNCGRELLLSQLLEGPVLSGGCPWCGVIMAPDYTDHLLTTVRRLEAAGAEFERALGRLRGGWARFRIDRDSTLGRLDRLLAEHERATPLPPPRRKAARDYRRRGRFSHLAPGRLTMQRGDARRYQHVGMTNGRRARTAVRSSSTDVRSQMSSEVLDRVRTRESS